MRKIRVLVVDDSTVIRRMVSDVLSQDSEIEVAATAPNGKIAMEKLIQISPDVVTLDIEMPEMNGLETLANLRKSFPSLPVIMFSTLCERGAESTLDALSKGASDYVTKPANMGSVKESMQKIKDDLVPKIKHLCKWYRDLKNPTLLAQTGRSLSAKHPNSLRQPKPFNRKDCRIDIIAIGVSTGGPNALMEVLSQLPKEFPVPILVVQHMPPVFTKHLANRLNQNCAIDVVEAELGDSLREGTVYIAPGDWHMQIRRIGLGVQLELNQAPQENSCRPAVDVLFRSVADVYGPNALAVVLTGMGQDGLRGSEAIRDAGGAVFAQDEASSVVWGMPRAVIHAGIAHETLALHEVADKLCNTCACGRTKRRPERIQI